MKWFQHTGKQPMFDEVSWAVYLGNKEPAHRHIFLYERMPMATRAVTLARRREDPEQASRARAYPGNQVKSIKPLYGAHPFWWTQGHDELPF